MRSFIKLVFLPLTLGIAAIWITIGFAASSFRFGITYFSTICVILVLGYVTMQI